MTARTDADDKNSGPGEDEGSKGARKAKTKDKSTKNTLAPASTDRVASTMRRSSQVDGGPAKPSRFSGVFKLRSSNKGTIHINDRVLELREKLGSGAWSGRPASL